VSVGLFFLVGADLSSGESWERLNKDIGYSISGFLVLGVLTVHSCRTVMIIL
jgi:hypothetical protein